MSADPRVTTEAAIARLSGQLEGIGREIGQMRKDVAGDLARVDERLDRLTEQVTTANGRVRAHDMELAEIRIRADERARAQADHATEQTAALQRADRRWTRIAWAIGVALTITIAGVGWIIAVLG